MQNKENCVYIFVGDGESRELSALAREKEKEGYTVAPDSGHPKIQTVLSQVAGKNVIVEGAKLAHCVNRVVKSSLDNGANQVIVDLNKTFTDEDDIYDHEFILQERAHNFSIIAASRQYKESGHKVAVFPEHIWESELESLKLQPLSLKPHL